MNMRAVRHRLLVGMIRIGKAACWWTRSQSIRTSGETSFEVVLLEANPPPVYQRIATQARRLRDLGLSHSRIAQNLGVTDKTVAKAIARRGR